MNTMPTHQSALQELRVIDLTTVDFGPAVTQTLANHGAIVVTIAVPGRDVTGVSGPPDERSMSPYLPNAIRGKRSVVRNLKAEAGRETYLVVTDGADGFIHHVRP
jgi:crotonobetainyl-CoA:carnitine CoA-transferase CaiB-like acyl-CoA transferase